MLVHTLPTLVEATVLRRPSASIKSPYIADIRFADGTIGLCHTPGLSCSGLVAPGTRIFVSENDDHEIKTGWIAHAAKTPSTIIGIHPPSIKNATYALLHTLHPDAHWQSDVPVKGHRIDYVGYCPNGQHIYVEIKPVFTSPVGKVVVPECKSAKERTETNVLKTLVGHPNTHSCHFLFLIPHSDCESVQIDSKDDTYSSKMRQAIDKGIRLHAFVLDYDLEGDITFQKEVPVHQV
jgi:DNA-binding sugar fermentation-stimulating protein